MPGIPIRNQPGTNPARFRQAASGLAPSCFFFKGPRRALIKGRYIQGRRHVSRSLICRFASAYSFSAFLSLVTRTCRYVGGLSISHNQWSCTLGPSFDSLVSCPAQEGKNAGQMILAEDTLRSASLMVLLPSFKLVCIWPAAPDSSHGVLRANAGPSRRATFFEIGWVVMEAFLS
jgi:hypothetical protein